MDNPLSELEALPEELWLTIQRLTDRQSLATLVFTSRRCLNSFELSCDEIWGRVCLDDMHRGVLFDALAVRDASDAFQHGHDMGVVLEFLEGSNSVEKTGGTEKYELRQSVRVQAQNVLWAELVPLHLIESDLAAQIASEWCEVHPFDCLHPNGRKYLVGFRKPVGIDPLSLEELNRAGNDQPFSGDNISRPNKAWVWSTDGLYEFENSRAKNIAMRSWGYVFWDQKRLYEWGVLDIRRELFQEDAAIYPPNCHCDPDSLGAPFPRVNPAGIHTCFIQSLKRAIG